jgi:predicted RNA-binding protein with PUA domain
MQDFASKMEKKSLKESIWLRNKRKNCFKNGKNSQKVKLFTFHHSISNFEIEKNGNIFGVAGN